MDADTVTAVEEKEEAPVVEEHVEQQDVQDESEEQEVENKQVPLKALMKEKKRRQEAEMKSQWAEERLNQLTSQLNQATTKADEDDESNYEAVTKGDLKSYSMNERQEIIRTIKEEDWVKSNPDKVETINEKLPELLKKKPHLSYSIMHSTNRYEEAWDQLMGHNKIAQPKPVAVKKEIKAPGSPASLPKSAGVTQTMNLMHMSDSEFNEWRKKQRRTR